MYAHIRYMCTYTYDPMRMQHCEHELALLLAGWWVRCVRLKFHAAILWLFNKTHLFGVRALVAGSTVPKPNEKLYGTGVNGI